MRLSKLFLMTALVAGCAQQQQRSAIVSPPARAHSLTEQQVLAIARQAHATMSVHPPKYTVNGLSAEQDGTNWAVTVWLVYEASPNPCVGDWDADGELFRISGDGKVLSFAPSV